MGPKNPEPKDLAAFVRDRLHNFAGRDKRDFNLVLKAGRSKEATLRRLATLNAWM
jgi:hypothetical protein